MIQASSGRRSTPCVNSQSKSNVDRLLFLLLLLLLFGLLLLLGFFSSGLRFFLFVLRILLAEDGFIALGEVLRFTQTNANDAHGSVPFTWNDNVAPVKPRRGGFAQRSAIGWRAQSRAIASN